MADKKSQICNGNSDHMSGQDMGPNQAVDGNYKGAEENSDYEMVVGEADQVDEF